MRAPPSDPVLIVEDNLATRAGLASLLNFSGYVTVTCRTAEEALAYLQNGGGPCIIVLDLGLGPGMTGSELREVLLADPRLAAIPVVVYSGFDEPRVPKVVAQLRKSAHPDDLLRVIEQWCMRPDGVAEA
jgi:CheY-like chemotaxis protein